MPLTWFLLVAVMLTAYVVLDGFDLGVGMLHLFVARTEEERRDLIRTIGPVWDGNEVWLLAGGGTLYFAFPLLYASGFSGFYLPLMIVLWLLIFRGIGVELRMHLETPVWRGLFNGAFGTRELPAGRVLRRGAGERDSWRAVGKRRLLLPAAVDRLAGGSAAGSAGLVHGAGRRDGGRGAGAARRALRGAENRRRTEPARAAGGADAVAGGGGSDRGQPGGHALHPAEPAGQLPQRRRSCMPFRRWWRRRSRVCGCWGERATSAVRSFLPALT